MFSGGSIYYLLFCSWYFATGVIIKTFFTCQLVQNYSLFSLLLDSVLLVSCYGPCFFQSWDFSMVINMDLFTLISMQPSRLASTLLKDAFYFLLFSFSSGFLVINWLFMGVWNLSGSLLEVYWPIWMYLCQHHHVFIIIPCITNWYHDGDICNCSFIVQEYFS